MFFARLLSRAPLSVLYFLSDVLFLISFYVVRYRRKLVRKNLQASFPHKQPQALYEIEKSFYKNLCDYAVETLKLITISREELKRRMVFTNPHITEKYRQQNQSILILAAHQFNWEWLVTAACFNLPFQIDFVYQQVNNGFFDKISRATRTRFGAHAIMRQEVAREIVKRRHILRAIATMADQYPGYNHDKKFIAPFLHQQTVFFHGVNQMAQLTQYPVLFFQIKKVRRGYYETHAVELAMPPHAKDDNTVIERYIAIVEQAIHESPTTWLWSHNRWKQRQLENVVNRIS